MTGLAALVFALGLRHGFDPDHLVAIDGLTRSSKSRWCGLFFSLGHGVAAQGCRGRSEVSGSGTGVPLAVDREPTVVLLHSATTVGVVLPAALDPRTACRRAVQ